MVQGFFDICDESMKLSSAKDQKDQKIYVGFDMSFSTLRCSFSGPPLASTAWNPKNMHPNMHCICNLTAQIRCISHL